MSSNPQGNSSTTQENEHLFTDDGLTRKLGLSTAIAICIGTTVGSGIFSSIGEIANASGSALFIALSFFLGGLYQIPASLFYAELYSAYPVNGGIYKNFEMADWRPIAFISGATQFVGSDPPGLSVMALSIASYIGYFTHHSELTGKFIAVAFILVFMFIHIRSVEGGGKILDIITTFKIIPFVVLAGVAIFYARGELLTAPPAPGAPAGFTALLAGISATTWSYDGTSQVVLVAGEIKNPKKNMPRALILSVLLITAFYTIFSTAMAGLLPINQLAASSAPVADAVSTIPGIGKAAGSTWFQDYFFEDINRNCIGYINIDSTGMIDCTTYENEASRELSDYAINMVSQVLGEDSLMYYLEKTGDQSFFGVGVPSIAGRCGLSHEMIVAQNGACLGWWNHTSQDGLDKMDPAVLERDDKVAVGMLLGLVNAPILPYDFSKSCQDLQEKLLSIRQDSGNIIDLNGICSDVEKLSSQVEKLNHYHTLPHQDLTAEQAQKINEALLYLSRCLTNVMFTYSDKFNQDSYGLSILSKPIPLLYETIALKEMDPATLDYKLLYTKLLRNRNRVADAIQAANQHLELLLGYLSLGGAK